jgi:hypothetical protein
MGAVLAVPTAVVAEVVQGVLEQTQLPLPAQYFQQVVLVVAVLRLP